MSSTLAADDPLANILSDGSDDSFFDDPKTVARKASLTKTPEKKKVNDLFNISDEKVTEKNEPAVSNKMDNDWLGLGSSVSKSKDSGFETEKPATLQQKSKKISFEDDDDILGTLGLGKKSAEKVEEKKPVESSKKLNLLESILGSPKQEKKKITSFEDILKDSKATNVPKSSDIKSQPSSIPLKTETQSQPALGFSSLDASREGRRGRRSSGGLLDPLGLFSNESKVSSAVPPTESRELTPKIALADKSGPKVETLYTSKPKEISQVGAADTIQDQGLPDWLGGSSFKTQESKQPQLIKQEKSQDKLGIQAETTPVQQQHSREIIENKSETITTQLPDVDPHIMPSLLAQQKLVHSNIEYQNTAMALQQQESQLLMALQLKKYEDNLAAMQQQQQELLVKQEQQFNILLERQFSKQQVIENSMKLQQERINNHIQLLLSQPSLPKSVHQEQVEELEKTAKEEDVKLYEHMLESLRKRQHEELFLLEESYKKQISLLEHTMESVENRLKDEVSRLAENYDARIKQITQEHVEEQRKSSVRLRELEQYHLDEIKQIRENHNRVTEEIKYEHNSVLEAIKNVKQTEEAVFKDANTYSEKLDSNMQALYSSSKLLQDIQDRVHKDYGVLSLAREESLKAKEKEIADMRVTLDKCREAADLERAQLMGLVRSLEMKLSEQNQAAKEERWAFQQAAATLTARSAALDREMNFNRSALEREREQLKTLRETMLAEQENAILQLTEEKLVLAAEKSRLETSNKLATNYDLQKNKAEIDAALQVAKEAAELADKERERLHQQQAEVESRKRSLKEKERMLTTRENEMRNLIHNTDRRIQDAEKRMHEARLIESKYNDKFRELQNQLSSLSRREKKLSDEKIALSKERLALHTLMREKRNCGLCAADQPRMDEQHSSYHEISQDVPRVMSVVDRDLVRFRMEATEDEQDDTLAGGNISI